MPLTAKQVENTKPRQSNSGSPATARVLDANGLYLEVSPTGSKRWVLRYSRNGKVTEKAIGSCEFVSLAQARDAAFEFRKSVATGVPLPARKATFGDCAEELIASREGYWKSAATAKQWRYLLRDYAQPIMKLDVARVDVTAVLSVLTPIWNEKNAAAKLLRSIIEVTIDAARVKGLRNGENPARMRGNLGLVLPRSKSLSRGHNAALPYATIPMLMRKLETENGVVTRAMRLAILCAL
jgi:hypothetical protein